ncbi:acyl-CoA synthetase [Rhodococcus rhodnii]|nr:AMP-binding protein [Rhodococcus rhodnii]TXG92738.1 acyl-CoA synthetase [Rhodococcus rhodnii]
MRKGVRVRAARAEVDVSTGGSSEDPSRGLSTTLFGPVRRIFATAQNGLEVVRLGGLEMDRTRSPYEIVERTPMYRLRRYFPRDDVRATSAPPVVLVPPMMMSADVYDVTKDDGAVAILHRAGLDPWVVDFGSPDVEEGGLDRNLADHILAISDVVDAVKSHTGRDVHLGGYSQGGMFAYQAAAYRRSSAIASIVTFGSPVDTLGGLPFGIPADLASGAAEFLADHVFTHLAVTGWMARTGFQLLDPVKSVRTRLDFLRQLHDRDALLPREQQRRFLAAEGWVAWSGPAVADLLRQFVVHNRMLTGGFVIRDAPVSLAEITVPVLAFSGEVDDIGQTVAVRGIARAAPRAEVHESVLRSGHFGLVVGSGSVTHSWPTTAEWVLWREGLGPEPSAIERMSTTASARAYSSGTLTARLIHTAASAAEVGLGVGRVVGDIASGTVRSGLELSSEASRALPRLARLGQIQSHSRISLGLLLAERRRKAPSGEFFLFDDRVHTNAAVGDRVDRIVAGLIHEGVRPGARVGILMDTRPSALATAAALSRIGAVAVQLPADAERLCEALEIAAVTRVVTDPEHLAAATTADVAVLVLGGGDLRTLDIDVDSGATVTDLEHLDVDSFELPAWYVPDPGLAREVAFIFFTEIDGRLEQRQITNHRWALSAFGTASAADLDGSDTVLCLTPMHHPSALLAAVGGAVAGGARIAVARTVDQADFTRLVHRYGVTVVSYTWAMLREVTGEESSAIGPGGLHPIRLFMGAGMPVGLWNRTVEHFSPAGVLEFYASSEGNVVLANVSGTKVGCKGRPLPGSADVKVGAWDPVTREFLLDDRGFVRECEDDEVGLLLGQAGDVATIQGTALRSVFAPGDAWTPTEHLFRRDSDGDHWLMDRGDDVVLTDDGPVYGQPIVDALGSLDTIDLAVVYGVRVGDRDLVVAAYTLRDGRAPTAAQLEDALDVLPAAGRPDILATVPEIAVSPSFRPSDRGLREQGLPAPGPRVRCLDRETGSYKRLTKAAVARLSGE